LAEDVTQGVFLVLAQKARQLPRDLVLQAWLLRVLRHTAANALRSQSRRIRHEREAGVMISMTSDSQSMTPGQWETIVLALNELTGKLSQKDQQAVLLRFYRRKTFAEVGAAMQISEEAAKKRVARAMQKLRKRLEKRGLTLSAAALATGLFTYTTQTASTTLAASIIAACASAPAAVAPSVWAIAKAAMQIMAWAKVKTAAVCVGMLVFAAGGALVVHELASNIKLSAKKAAATESNKRDLLDSVRAMRAALLPAIRSGRGLAEVEGSRDLHAQRVENQPRRRVDFLFSANNSLSREFDEQEPTKALQSILLKDSKITSYFAGTKQVPTPAVTISSAAVLTGVLPMPTGWSFADIAQLPIPVKDEAQFFALASQSPFVTVQRNQQIITVTIDEPIPSDDPAGRQSEQRVLDFDMAHGGMFSRFSHTIRRTRQGRQEEIVENLEMKWETRDALVVPVQRRARASMAVDGKPAQLIQSVVDFKQFTPGEVDDSELTVEKLAIPVGTKVVDQLLGLEYKYNNPDDLDATVRDIGKGQATPTATPPGTAVQGAPPSRVQDGTTHQPIDHNMLLVGWRRPALVALLACLLVGVLVSGWLRHRTRTR
jgi:RNA polymerase sigma factor (sigma-70 family)